MPKSGGPLKGGSGTLIDAARPGTTMGAVARRAGRRHHGAHAYTRAPEIWLHGLTTQEPFEVWPPIDRKARKPTVDYPPLRLVRFSGAALTEGIERHDIDGVSVPVTSAARTVADCFLYRNEIGIDVAVEALRDYRDMRQGTLDELWDAAVLRRV